MRVTNLLCNVFRQTTINPGSGYDLLKSIDKVALNPSSLFVISTPQNIVNISSQIKELRHQFPTLKVINVSLDSNFGNSVSELWTNDPIEVLDYSIDHGTQNSKNWIIRNANLMLQFRNGINAKLTPSNTTLFYNEKPFHMMIHADHEVSGSNLQNLSLKLPFSVTKFTHKSNLIPLNTGILRVSKHGGNLIREINNKGAASYLINGLKDHPELQNVQIQAFAEISDKGGNKNIYEVVAGGGEWGPRSDSLVLKGLETVPDGSTLKLFISDPRNLQLFKPFDGQIYFENVLEEELYRASDDEKTLNGTFGFGSTDGFEIDAVNYRSPGELVIFDVSY